MRWIAGIAAGYAAGVLLERLWPPGVVVLAVVFVTLLLAAWSLGPRAVLAAAVVAGALAAAGQRAEVAAGPDWPAPWPPPPRQIFRLEGVVASAPEAAPPDGWRAEVDVDVVEGATRQAAAARLVVRWDAKATTLRPGERVRFQARLREPRGYANPGAFDRAGFLAGQDVQAVASALPPGPVRLAGSHANLLGGLAAARQRMAARIRAIAPGDGGALVVALALGDRAGIRPSVDDDFRRAGVTHVLSVSGLHLAAVALLAYALARRAWLRLGPERFPAERFAALVAAPLAMAYTWLTGAEIATLRSLVATLVVLAAAALGRRPHGITALAVAALVLLAGAPWAIFEPSFQLSFAAAAALLTLAVRWAPPRSDRPLRDWLLRALAATFAASLATAPLTALHFGAIQPAGLVANLVVVPVAELAVLPLGLAGSLLAGVWTPLGWPLLGLAALLAAGLVHVVAALAAVAPVLAVPSPTALELAAFAVALGALALLPVGKALRVAGLASLLAAASCWHGHVARPDFSDQLVITFLDVGQGDAAVVELPGGKTWLIDAGGSLFGPPTTTRDARLAARASDPGEQAVWPFLRARRIRRLERVIVSHPHPDHVGGLTALAEHLPIDELWLTGDEVRGEAWPALLASLERSGTRIVRPELGVADKSDDGSVSLRVLAPRYQGERVEPTHEGENDDSLVVAVERAGRRVLFLGDLEHAGEAALVGGTPPGELHADVVKVAHHGSRTSSSEALVAATRPALAVISCGVANSFGFPAPEVVERWAERSRVLRTDVSGAIQVSIDRGGNLAVSTFLEAE